LAPRRRPGHASRAVGPGHASPDDGPGYASFAYGPEHLCDAAKAPSNDESVGSRKDR